MNSCVDMAQAIEGAAGSIALAIGFVVIIWGLVQWVKMQ